MMILSTMVLVFTLGLAFFITNFTMTTFVDKVVTIPAINESSGALQSFNSIKTTVNRLDYVAG
jgi:hypothetical protein